MKKTYPISLSARNKELMTKCRKMLERLQSKLNNGNYVKLSQRRRQQLHKQIRRYALRLQKTGLNLQKVAAGFTLAFTLALASPADAQIIFEKQNTGPLHGVNVGFLPISSFVDIDGDGDQDVFIGENEGTILYYKNDGTNMSPQFTEQMGTANPFDGVDVSFTASPVFVDIDGDGDQDAFVGEFNGTILFYKNEGTNIAPQFAEQMGIANPFDGVNVGDLPVPSFVDIDGDGDQDAFIGKNEGTINYYKNEGTNIAPQFTEQIGTAANPLGEVDVSFTSFPRFVDIDEDGDQDVFVGEYYGRIFYFENVGTHMSPQFTQQIGAANLFDGVDVGYTAIPSFVDIDGDGDQDAFVGEREGTISYYKNTILSVAVKDIVEAGISLEVFPNPTSDRVEIQGTQIEQIEVLDIHGRLLRTVFSPTSTLDISDLADGMYFLRIKVEDQFLMSQIVKSK